MTEFKFRVQVFELEPVLLALRAQVSAIYDKPRYDYLTTRLDLLQGADPSAEVDVAVSPAPPRRYYYDYES
jgi:hypothetical protein